MNQETKEPITLERRALHLILKNQCAMMLVLKDVPVNVGPLLNSMNQSAILNQLDVTAAMMDELLGKIK